MELYGSVHRRWEFHDAKKGTFVQDMADVTAFDVLHSQSTFCVHSAH